MSDRDSNEHDESADPEVSGRVRLNPDASRTGDRLDVYLIHTMPSPKAMAKYKRYKARIVVVDPGEAIVTQRIQAMRSPEMERVATRWYRARAGRPREAMPQASRSW